jgi:hypothetical protein
MMTAAAISGGLFLAFWIGAAIGVVVGIALGIDGDELHHDGDDWLLPSERDQ